VTFTIAAKNASQKITGSTVSVKVDPVSQSATTIHTCPTGSNQKIHVIAFLQEMGLRQNARIRVASQLVYQWGQDEQTPPVDCASCVAPPILIEDLGLFVLLAGETVSVNAQVSGTAGAIVRVSVAVLEQTPN